MGSRPALPHCVLTRRKVWRPLGSLFYDSNNPIYEGFTLMTYVPPSRPTSKYHFWEQGFHRIGFWGGGVGGHEHSDHNEVQGHAVTEGQIRRLMQQTDCRAHVLTLQRDPAPQAQPRLFHRISLLVPLSVSFFLSKFLSYLMT